MSFRPFYLSGGGEPVLSLFHPAAGDVAVLMCPPFGWDDICSYRSRRDWAERLATAGYPALRFDLPGTGDSIWARGEIRFDELGMDLVHGTGVALVGMARGHQRLIRDYLYEQRKTKLQRILQLVRKNRYHR